MKKDMTSIEYWAGKSWKRAEEWLKSNAHMLALGDSDDGVQVARSSVGSGEEAGTAVLAAFLALRKNGLPRFAMESVCVYKGIAEEAAKDERIGKERVAKLACRVRNLEHWVAFVQGSMSCSKFVWPLKMPAKMWADLGRRSGMANVMMAISIREFSEGATTEYIAAAQMSRFIQEGMDDN